MTDYIVPFDFDDPSSHGLRTLTGMLRYDGKALHIEFQAKDSILGVVKGDVKDLKIAISDLVHVEYVHKWLSRKLVFQSQSMRTFEGFPSSTGATMEIKIKKKNQSQAQNMASTMMLHISEEKLRQLDQ